MNIHRRSIVSRLLVGAGISVLIISICILTLAFFGILKIGIDRSDCDDVLESFAESMRRNKMEAAKSFTSPEQWNRVAAWMAGREGIDCSFSLDSFEPDHNQWWWVRSQCVDHQDMVCGNFGFMCSYNQGIYYLSIENVVLQKSEEKCKVVKWDKICEAAPDAWGERCE
jgi:hypothetical protein